MAFDVKTQPIAITKADGGVAITRILVGAPRGAFSPDAAEANGFALTEDGTRWVRELTDAMIEAEIARTPTLAEQLVSWRRIAEADVPPEAHRSFREAWRDDGKIVAVDMQKAKAIHRDRLRAERDPLLTKLDGEYVRAAESGAAEAQRAVVMRKQALRDVPAHPMIEAADTPEKLTRLTLSALTTEK